MEQYIPKSALVAEIKRLIKHSEMVADHNTQITELVSRELDTLYHLISFTNSLDVKEVDLEKELDSFAYSLPHSAMGSGSRLRHFDDPRVIEARDGGWTHSWKYDEIKKIAKHFFELGLNAQQKEVSELTWEDMLLIHRHIKDAMNYHLYGFQSVDGQQKIYEDVLRRFKAQKGD